jgi:hypothetical protein
MPINLNSSHKLFKKHIGLTLLSKQNIRIQIMPSTSPSNTRPLNKKRKDWHIIKKYLLNKQMEKGSEIKNGKRNL